MRLDGYIRVSRVAGRSGESFISPKVQRDKIEALATIQNRFGEMTPGLPGRPGL